MNLFIWLIVALLEAFRHVILIRVEKISPNKFFSLAARVAVAGVLCWLDLRQLPSYAPFYEYVIICGAYFFSGWFIHDTILAVFAMKQKPWYLNGTGPIDRVQSGWLPVWWFFKGLFALTFSAMYFFN